MKDVREILSITLLVVFLWAICFGVTVNGKHYGLTKCDKNGLHVDDGAPPSSD